MKRQLDKMTLLTEQARSPGFQAAAAAERADQGADADRRLVRILTPLLKFRACRDARKVCGDGMEVRGGCGYIEEWTEPRLLRDAHLGSIWEGTSNIVALDVYRGIRKEQTLDVFEAHFNKLASEVYDAELRHEVSVALKRAVELTRAMVEQDIEDAAREVSSLLYCVASAVTFAWEASNDSLRHRRSLAEATLRHRVQPLFFRLSAETKTL
jgi:hypothetical protein